MSFLYLEARKGILRRYTLIALALFLCLNTVKIIADYRAGEIRPVAANTSGMQTGYNTIYERIKGPITEETVRFLTSPQLGPQPLADVWNSLDGFSYGKLMRVMRDPGRYPGLSRMDEYGWDGWLGTYFANFPHEQMTMLMMTQRTDHGTGPLTRKLRNLLLSSTEARL